MNKGSINRQFSLKFTSVGRWIHS